MIVEADICCDLNACLSKLQSGRNAFVVQNAALVRDK